MTERTDTPVALTDAEIGEAKQWLADMVRWGGECLNCGGNSKQAEVSLRALDELEGLRDREEKRQRIGTHGPGCETWGYRHYECALRALSERTDERDSLDDACRQFGEEVDELRREITSSRKAVALQADAIKDALARLAEVERERDRLVTRLARLEAAGRNLIGRSNVGQLEAVEAENAKLRELAEDFIGHHIALAADGDPKDHDFDCMECDATGLDIHGRGGTHWSNCIVGQVVAALGTRAALARTEENDE